MPVAVLDIRCVSTRGKAVLYLALARLARRVIRVRSSGDRDQPRGRDISVEGVRKNSYLDARRYALHTEG